MSLHTTSKSLSTIRNIWPHIPERVPFLVYENGSSVRYDTVFTYRWYDTVWDMYIFPYFETPDKLLDYTLDDMLDTTPERSVLNTETRFYCYGSLL